MIFVGIVACRFDAKIL